MQCVQGITAASQVQRQLQSAESAVSSLQRQLEEVVGGDTLRQLRDHYEATLAAASERHSAAVLRLQQELDGLKGGAELQEGVGREVEGRGPSMPPSFLGEALLSTGGVVWSPCACAGFTAYVCSGTIVG